MGIRGGQSNHVIVPYRCWLHTPKKDPRLSETRNPCEKPRYNVVFASARRANGMNFLTGGFFSGLPSNAFRHC